MATTLRLSNSVELPLASAPMISGGLAQFLITPSSTVTAESVNTAVKDYSNTQSFQIVTDGSAGTAQLNYVLSGNVGIDSSTSNIVFTLKQKSDEQVQLDTLGKQLVAAQLEIAALKGGTSK